MRIGSRVVAVALAAGCTSMPAATDNTALAEVKTARGEAVGLATFTQVGNAVRIVLEARGLPAGAHAVHVHAVGRCEGPDFTTAGGHFNPLGKQHGALNAKGAHAGDLPNLTIAADGTGRMETTTEQLTLLEGPSSVWDADGSALVVHAAPDDFITDPTGNAGARIACGLITKPAPPGK